MHSSRMRTVRCSGHLSCHACMPLATHTPLPHMPPAMHASLPHLPHTPLPHTHPCHTCLPLATHAPLPRMPPCHTPHPMWTEFLTHACENITFPQLLLRTVTSDKILYDTPCSLMVHSHYPISMQVSIKCVQYPMEICIGLSSLNTSQFFTNHLLSRCKQTISYFIFSFKH